MNLLHLRARWYAPSEGVFLSRDPVESEPPYLYVRGNPVNFTDPSGMWRWRRAGNFYHGTIEAYYESNGLLRDVGILPNAAFVNPDKQLEYPIPGLGIITDMFNSRWGDVYEIEPIYAANMALPEAWGYVLALNFANIGNSLQGIAPNGWQHYNWKNTSFHLGTGIDWPGKLRTPLPGFPAVELVADYTWSGTALYWLEPKNGVPWPPPVPNRRLLKERDYQPKPRFVLQPAYAISWQETCGYTLIAIGGTILVFTVVTDITMVGTIDDVITVPGGYLLINIGQRLVTYVPAATSTVTNPTLTNPGLVPVPVP